MRHCQSCGEWCLSCVWWCVWAVYGGDCFSDFSWHCRLQRRELDSLEVPAATCLPHYLPPDICRHAFVAMHLSPCICRRAFVAVHVSHESSCASRTIELPWSPSTDVPAQCSPHPGPCFTATPNSCCILLNHQLLESDSDQAAESYHTIANTHNYHATRLMLMQGHGA